MKTLQTKTQTITTSRSIERFTVSISDDGAFAIDVQFAEVDRTADGTVLAKRFLPNVTVEKPALLAVLPNYGLPALDKLYAGISNLLHTERERQETVKAEAAAAAEASKVESAAKAAALSGSVGKTPTEPPPPKEKPESKP